MDFLSAEERYQRDPLFKQLVDVMVAHIYQLKFTPTEIREAAILAAIKFEYMNPRPLMFRHGSINRRADEILRVDLGEDSDPHSGRG